MTQNKIKYNDFNDEKVPNKKNNKNEIILIQELIKVPIEIHEDNENLICPLCEKFIEKILKRNFTKTITQHSECSKCKIKFYNIKCLHCCEPIYILNGNSLDYNLGINIQCPYMGCNKIFSYSTCGKCKKYVGIKEKFSEGSNITCTYEDCLASSITNICPFKECKYLNIYPNKKYFEGYEIKCISDSCRKKYIKFNCLSCSKRFYSDNYNKSYYYEGRKIICPYDSCSLSQNKFICPLCLRNITIKNIDYEKNNKKNFNFIKCPYEDCKKNFTKIICPKCLGVNEYIGLNNLEGKRIRCAFRECNFDFYFYNCLRCNKLNIWEGKIFLYFRK